MVKKINQDAVSIKSLLSKGYKQSDIVKILKLSKQKVHYWVKNPVRTEQKKYMIKKKKGIPKFWISKSDNKRSNKI